MKRKILIIVPSLRGGGSERVISILVRHLDKTKFKITLVMLQKEGEYLQDLPEDVEVVDLEAKQARYAIVKIVSNIKRIKPDVVLSTLGYLNLLMAMIRPLLPKRIRFVGRESNTVSIKNKYYKYPRLYDWLYRIFYKNFDLIVSQSEYMKKDLIENYRMDAEKIIVINNPVETEKIENFANEASGLLLQRNKTNLLAVGRLTHQKGFDLLIKTMKKLGSGFHLTILGDQRGKKDLVQLAERLGVADNITFAGFQKNPYTYLRQADLFVLSSRFEGFPNALIEANCCGIPAVAFDCPGGTGEIIQTGLNGFLCRCGDIDDLALKIQEAIEYPFDQTKIRDMIRNKYDVNTIMNQYEKVLL